MVAACPFPANHGGAASIREMSEALKRLGHEVHVVTYPIKEDIPYAGGTVHRVRAGWLKPGAARIGPSLDKIVYDFLLVFKLLKVIRKHKIDVIHAHHYEAAVVGWLGKLLGRTPMLYNAVTNLKDELPTYNFIRPKWLAREVGRLFDWIVPRSASVITVVSDELKSYLVVGGLPEHRVKVVPAGVNLEMFEHGNAARIRLQYGLGSAPVVMYTGAFEEFQRIDYLLGAMQVLVRSRPDARLMLVGSIKSPSQSAKYQSMAESLGIADKTIFIESAPLEDLADYLAAATVAVVPRTDCPGHPVKLLNYMAAGKPIASFYGGAKGLHHMYNAYLAEDHDVSALARGIGFLIDNPEKASALGDRARDTIREVFDWNTLARGIELIYRELLHGAGEFKGNRPNPYLKEGYTLAYVDRRSRNGYSEKTQRKGTDRRVRSVPIDFIERREVSFAQPVIQQKQETEGAQEDVRAGT